MRLLWSVALLFSLVAEFTTAQRCRGVPDAPEYASVRCFKKRNICRAVCESGYLFSHNGKSNAMYDCEDGAWKPRDTLSSFLQCIPVCDPPCENGLCGAPNICECVVGWTGDICDEEEEKEPESEEVYYYETTPEPPHDEDNYEGYDEEEDYQSSEEEEDDVEEYVVEPSPATYQYEERTSPIAVPIIGGAIFLSVFAAGAHHFLRRT